MLSLLLLLEKGYKSTISNDIATSIQKSKSNIKVNQTLSLVTTLTKVLLLLLLITLH